ncbi:MAG: hypothetical protein E7047_03570 [Lentisphaerae bacterium]|nr:hypothetical protein [Lentisphaerota bacterium]
MKNRRPHFTIVELLIIIAIICVIAALLVSMFADSNSRARLTACANHQRNIAQCITFYSCDNSGEIPNIMPGLENNSIPILRLPDYSPVALGRLIGSYTHEPGIFGCPDSPGYDQHCVVKNYRTIPMVWSGYLYRARACDFNGQLSAQDNINRAIVMDFACITPQGEQFAPHRYQLSNILYSDGHVEGRRNSREPFRFYTAQAARHGELMPDCTLLWQRADAVD